VPEQERLSHIINFRVTADEFGLIAAAATKDGKLVSAWLREASVGVAEIVVHDPTFTIAPCAKCGYVPPGHEIPKDAP
jgi:uncharacterized protein (DUF1778 family)